MVQASGAGWPVFVLSKLAWMLLRPGSLILILICVGLALSFLDGRAGRIGRGLVTTAAAVFAAVTLLPVGTWLLAPLETRFPVPASPGRVDGIVVLGGSFAAGLDRPGGTVPLNDAAERLTAFVELARRHPAARLVFTGGIGAIDRDRPTEAALAQRFFREIGFDARGVEFDAAARNTFENAVQALALARPAPGERWLVVTSAYHMPRSVGCFRAAGFPVVAWPTDHRLPAEAGGWLTDDLGLDPVRRLARLELAMREWGGLLAYWLMGRTSALFPSQDPGT